MSNIKPEIIPVEGYAQITIRAADLAAGLRFYGECLGLSVIERSEHRALLAFPEGMRLEILDGGCYVEHESGYTHLCINTYDVDETYARTLAYGATPTRGEPSTDGELRGVFIRTPTGEEIELWYISRGGLTSEPIVNGRYVKSFVHMAVTAPDKDITRDFYAALGVRPKTDWGWGCSMQLKNAHELEVFPKGDGLPHEEGSAVEQTFSTRDVPAVYAQAIAAGAVSLATPKGEKGHCTAAFRGPAGERISLTDEWFPDEVVLFD